MGTSVNSTLQKIANQYPKYMHDEYGLMKWANKTYPQETKYASFIFMDDESDFVSPKILRKQLINHTISFQDYVTQVTANSDSGQYQVNNFKNSPIGAYAYPQNSPNYGLGVVIISRFS